MSLPFSLPQPPAVEIPEEVKDHINHMVFGFESNLSRLGMLTMGRAGGWIEQYRSQLNDLALLCLRRELAGRPSSVGGIR